MADLDTHLVADLAVELRRQRRSAARQRSQGRDDRFAWLLALFGQEHLVERGRPAGHRDPVALGRTRLPGRERTRPTITADMPVDQHHDQVVGPRDVCERECDRADVVGRSSRVRRRGPVRRRSASRRCAARPSGPRWCRRSSRSSAPARRRRRGPAPVAASTRSAADTLAAAATTRQISTTGGDRILRASRGPSRSSRSRSTCPARCRTRASVWLDHEAEFLVAVQVQHRALQGSRDGERRRGDDGVDGGGELPGDRGCRRRFHELPAPRHALGPIPELSVGHSWPSSPMSMSRSGVEPARSVYEVPYGCHAPKIAPLPGPWGRSGDPTTSDSDAPARALPSAGPRPIHHRASGPLRPARRHRRRGPRRHDVFSQPVPRIARHLSRMEYLMSDRLEGMSAQLADHSCDCHPDGPRSFRAGPGVRVVGQSPPFDESRQDLVLRRATLDREGDVVW